jgi:transcriptional regulator with XRE-family HTH domain
MVKRSADPSPEDQAIGWRTRVVRGRRGMSLDVAAGLAGISKSQLSKLENGIKGFTQRGLLEDLAQALSCSVADLTGQPYPLKDRESIAVADAVSEIGRAMYDTTLDNLPDIPARPLRELVAGAALAHASADEARYVPAGRGLADLLVELHLQAATSGGEQRQAALSALVEACKVAYILAKRIGRIELATFAAERGREAAQVAERPDLIALMEMNRTSALLAVGARRRGRLVCAEALRDISSHAGPSRTDTTAAESAGMLHLTTALIAVRGGRGQDADAHLVEARSLAAHTGERTSMRYHFGPTNVAAWELGLAVESGTGPAVAQRLAATPIDLSVFKSKGRVAYVHFDLARAWAQAEGPHDDAVIRALDAADRLAPVRIRNDPLARDLAVSLRRRAKRRVWELDSLCNRLGVA